MSETNERELLTMTVQDVTDRVDRIVAAMDDDLELPHGLEDDLYRDVLRAIALGHPFAATLAAHALKSQDYGFWRVSL